jgi:RNA polymerase sigma-70 factor (ECF subfamily)
MSIVEKPMHPDSMQTDFPEREAVLRALRGDGPAFKEVVMLYGRRLYAVAYGVLQDAAEAEDVVQETFLKAHSCRRTIRDPERFPAWLFRTARNRALNVLRKRRPYADPQAGRPLPEIADDRAPCPSANLRETERNGAVQRLLSTLPENHRMAITLRFMEGMDYHEIEEAMGINPGTVRGILARAMKTLRKGVGTAPFADITGVNS